MLRGSACTEECWILGIADILSREGDDSINFLLGLINNYPADCIVLIWILESPFEIIITIIRLMYES